EGVSPRLDPYDPSRSARSVSMVISMIGGRALAWRVAGLRSLWHAAQQSNNDEMTADARMQNSVQLGRSLPPSLRDVVSWADKSRYDCSDVEDAMHRSIAALTTFLTAASAPTALA